MTNLQRAAVEYEQALINLKHATDSRGLKIMLGPTSGPLDLDNPLKARMPAAREYGVYLKEFVKYVDVEAVFIDDEANFARNVKLLAAAWEAAARYEELKRNG